MGGVNGIYLYGGSDENEMISDNIFALNLFGIAPARLAGQPDKQQPDLGEHELRNAPPKLLEKHNRRKHPRKQLERPNQHRLAPTWHEIMDE
ncbi:MAG: hypothetical protein QXG25_02095, partial [Nitrososphaerota archaeon]